MRRVTIGTTNVVTPMFASTEVVALFPAGVAGQTGLGDFFGAFVLEGTHLGGVTLFNMRLARTVTGFATGNVVLPTSNFGELRV